MGSSKMNPLGVNLQVANPLLFAPMGPGFEVNGMWHEYQSQLPPHSPGCSPRSVATTDARAPSPASLPSLDDSDVGHDNDSDVGDDSSFPVASHAARSEHSSSDSCSSDDEADFT